MKLQGQGKAPVFCFKGLDDAILTAGRHLKVFCRLFDGLMMQAVDRQLRPADHGGEQAAGPDLDHVGDFVPRETVMVIMPLGAGFLRLDMGV